MKRDMDLIRFILLQMEECESGYAPSKLCVDGYTQEQIGFHVLLMIGAGLITGYERDESGQSSPYAVPTHITWAGYEFLDASRDPERWEKAKGIFSKLGGVTMDIAIKILTDMIMKQFTQP